MPHLRTGSDLSLDLVSSIFHVFQAGIVLHVTCYSNKTNWIHIDLKPDDPILRSELLSNCGEK